MLRRGLDHAGIETVDHDIWQNPDDAAIVRHYANGNETVPTVVVGDVGLVNPSVKQLAAHLRQHAPHLLPAGFEESRRDSPVGSSAAEPRSPIG